MREDRGAKDVAVAVDGVDAVDHRDAAAGCSGPAAWNALTMSTQAPACSASGVEPPPESTDPRSQLRDQLGVVRDGATLGLRHLADLLLQRHAAKQVRDALVDRQRRVAVRRRRDRRAGRGLRCRQQRQDEYADGEPDATRSAKPPAARTVLSRCSSRLLLGSDCEPA